MRVAVVTTSYPATEGDPAGHFVRAEVRQLEREGHEVRVVTPLAGRAFGWPGVAARLAAAPWHAADMARWVVTARRELAAHAVDRVVCHWVVPSVIPIATGTHAPVEGVSHGGDVRLLVALPSRVRAALVDRIVRRVTRWRFVSGGLLEALCGALPSHTTALVRRVAIVEASPLELPETLPPSPARREDGRALFVSVGRLVASKRIERAIDYVATTGPTSHLVVVGDGPERTRLEAHARAKGVDARFVGKVPRNEALAWIAAADALVNASEAEGLSTVVREAEALGVRVQTIC